MCLPLALPPTRIWTYQLSRPDQAPEGGWGRMRSWMLRGVEAPLQANEIPHFGVLILLASQRPTRGQVLALTKPHNIGHHGPLVRPTNLLLLQMGSLRRPRYSLRRRQQRRGPPRKQHQQAVPLAGPHMLWLTILWICHPRHHSPQQNRQTPIAKDPLKMLEQPPQLAQKKTVHLTPVNLS